MKPVLNIDPRVKLFLFVITCVFVMSSVSFWMNLLLGTFITTLLVLSRKTGFALKLYLIFCAGLLAAENLHLVLPGTVGIVGMAFCVLLRITIPIMMAFSLVFQTTTISQFMAAFQKMHIPIKIIIPFAVMFRFIPTVQEEWICIRKAMAFRGIGLHAGGILRHPLISVEHILIPLLFSATAVMEELAAASLARGLDSSRDRTCLEEVRMTVWDYVFFVIVMGFAVIWLTGYAR